MNPLEREAASKPATPLPWKSIHGSGTMPLISKGEVVAYSMTQQDLDYAVEACNAYPSLRDRLDNAERERDALAASVKTVYEAADVQLRRADRYEQALQWIARPHGLTSKRCPVDERLQEAEDIATAALEPSPMTSEGETARKLTQLSQEVEGGYLSTEKDNS